MSDVNSVQIAFLEKNIHHVPFEDQGLFRTLIRRLESDNLVTCLIMSIEQIPHDLNKDWDILYVYSPPQDATIQMFRLFSSDYYIAKHGGEVKTFLKENVYPKLQEKELHPDLLTDLQWFVSEGCSCDDDLVLTYKELSGVIHDLNLSTVRGNVRVVYTREPRLPGKL